MKTIIEANTLQNIIDKLIAGEWFHSGYYPDNGNRYFLQYDGLTELYWLHKVGETLAVN